MLGWLCLLFAAFCEGTARTVPQFPLILLRFTSLPFNGRDETFVFLDQKVKAISENPMEMCLTVRNK